MYGSQTVGHECPRQAKCRQAHRKTACADTVSPATRPCFSACVHRGRGILVLLSLVLVVMLVSRWLCLRTLGVLLPS